MNVQKLSYGIEKEEVWQELCLRLKLQDQRDPGVQKAKEMAAR